jgi:hypothetical protein
MPGANQGISLKFCTRKDEIMKKASCSKGSCILYRGLEEIPMSDGERQQAIHALRDAEAVVHALIWVGQRRASLGAALPTLGFRHS